MTEAEMQQQIARLEGEMSGIKKDVAEVMAETRVTKHAVANMQLTQTAFTMRLDKVEEKILTKIDTLASEFGKDCKELGSQIAAVNIKHERGAGFFAGMAGLATVAGGVLLFIAKMLFAGG